MLPAILGAVAPIVSDLIDRAFPNSEERESKRQEYMLRLQEAANAIDLAQLEVNKTEASHASIFVAGWRPFIGWVCGFALAYACILQPFLTFLLANYLHHEVIMPEIESELLSYILMGMLGIGTMRTVEKLGGVTTGRAPERKTPLPWLKR